MLANNLSILIKTALVFLVRIMPTSMLIYSFVSVFAYEYLSDSDYYDFYVLTDNTVGYSIGACIVFLYLFFVSKGNDNIGRSINRIVTICLIVMNLVCIVYTMSNQNPRFLFLYQIMIVALVLLVKIMLFKRELKKINEIDY